MILQLKYFCHSTVQVITVTRIIGYTFPFTKNKLQITISRVKISVLLNKDLDDITEKLMDLYTFIYVCVCIYS